MQDSGGDRAIDRALAVVLVAGVTSTAFKLWIAGHTYGTNDVGYWTEFAGGVRRVGPIDIYGQQFIAQYNHGPGMGWLLVGLNWLEDRGAAFPLLIRAPSSVADLITGLVVFRLGCFVWSRRQAALVSVLVVWSPVMVVISGFHGNTDPVFVMFCLSSVYLLARDRPLAAGVCIGLALCVKLVPVVTLPWLLFVAWQRGSPTLTRYVAGGAIPFVVFWVPVTLLRWQEFRDAALGYRGIDVREWGLPALLVKLDLTEAGQFLMDHGAIAQLVVAAGFPFVVARFKQVTPAAGVGLALAVFLCVSTAYGMQYLSWPLAGSYLVIPIVATLYNFAASVFVVVVYSAWNVHQPPWRWDVATGAWFDPQQWHLMWLTWASLLLVVILGTWSLPRRRPRSAASAAPVRHREGAVRE